MTKNFNWKDNKEVVGTIVYGREVGLSYKDIKEALVASSKLKRVKGVKDITEASLRRANQRYRLLNSQQQKDIIHSSADKDIVNNILAKNKATTIKEEAKKKKALPKKAYRKFNWSNHKDIIEFIKKQRRKNIPFSTIRNQVIKKYGSRKGVKDLSPGSIRSVYFRNIDKKEEDALKEYVLPKRTPKKVIEDISIFFSEDIKKQTGIEYINVSEKNLESVISKIRGGVLNGN